MLGTWIPQIQGKWSSSSDHLIPTRIASSVRNPQASATPSHNAIVNLALPSAYGCRKDRTIPEPNFLPERNLEDADLVSVSTSMMGGFCQVWMDTEANTLSQMISLLFFDCRVSLLNRNFGIIPHGGHQDKRLIS